MPKSKSCIFFRSLIGLQGALFVYVVVEVTLTGFPFLLVYDKVVSYRHFYLLCTWMFLLQELDNVVLVANFLTAFMDV